jgi:membrane associated rhomboid family serine protease
MLSLCIVSVQIGADFRALNLVLLFPCHRGVGKVNKGLQLAHELRPTTGTQFDSGIVAAFRSCGRLLFHRALLYPCLFGRRNEDDMQDEVPPMLETENPELERSPGRAPIFNLPPVLTASLGLLIVIYLIQSLFLSEDTLDWFFFTFGFVPGRYVTPLTQQGWEWLWTPVTYSLLHASIQHILFNGLWLMAFGAPVARRIGPLRYILFWIISAIAAAALNAALHWGQMTLLIGASGVVSALMGAACRFVFQPARHGRPPQETHLNPRMSIAEALRTRTVITFILFWFLGNILIAFGVPLIGDGSQEIAWDAHVGGFLFGFLLFSIFDRPVDNNLPVDSEPLSEA